MTLGESSETVGPTSGPNVSDRPALPAGLVGLATTAGDEGWMSVEEPYTGTDLADVPACGKAAVELAVERAHEAQEGWAGRPAEERAAVLERFHDLVLKRQDELLDVVQLETGKARRHAYDEVMSVATTARYYAVRAPNYLEPERRRGAFPGLTRADAHHDPKGVVGLIAPWNYPFESPSPTRSRRYWPVTPSSASRPSRPHTSRSTPRDSSARRGSPRTSSRSSRGEARTSARR